MSSTMILRSACALLVITAPVIETRRVQVHVSDLKVAGKDVVLDKYVCGALESTYQACYPKARDWGLGAWQKAEACTTQCRRSMGMCWCPNSGESCISAGSSDPGFHFFSHGDNVERSVSEEGHAFPDEPLLKWPIKVNSVTREWQFLALNKEKGQNASRWVWQSPSAKGTSFLAPNAFARFNNYLNRNSTKVDMMPERILTEEGHSFPDGPSIQTSVTAVARASFEVNSCDPEQIAAFMQSQGM